MGGLEPQGTPPSRESSGRFGKGFWGQQTVTIEDTQTVPMAHVPNKPANLSIAEDNFLENRGQNIHQDIPTSPEAPSTYSFYTVLV